MNAITVYVRLLLLEGALVSVSTARARGRGAGTTRSGSREVTIDTEKRLEQLSNLRVFVL